MSEPSDNLLRCGTCGTNQNVVSRVFSKTYIFFTSFCTLNTFTIIMSIIVHVCKQECFDFSVISAVYI